MAPRSHETEDTSQTLALQALTHAAQRAGLDVTETATADALRALSTPQGMSLLLYFVSEGRRTSGKDGAGIRIIYTSQDTTQED